MVYLCQFRYFLFILVNFVFIDLLVYLGQFRSILPIFADFVYLGQFCLSRTELFLSTLILWSIFVNFCHFLSISVNPVSFLRFIHSSNIKAPFLFWVLFSFQIGFCPNREFLCCSYLLVPPLCILKVTTWLLSDPFSDKVWLCFTPDLRLFSCSAAAR